MTDIVTRLRTWVHAVDAAPASDLMDEAADEIARLRGDVEIDRLRLEAAHAEMERLRQRVGLWERCAAKTVEVYGGCIRPEYEKALEDAAVSMAGLVRLTADDRDTLQFAANMIQRDVADVSDGKRRADATGLVKDLRGLLKRAAL